MEKETEVKVETDKEIDDSLYTPKKQYCMNCGVEVLRNSAVCLNCGSHACGGDKYCKICGGAVKDFVCTSCGFKNTATAPYTKSRKKAGALFFGAFGAHDFYLGRKRRAIIKIVISILGGLITVGIATAFMVALGITDSIS
jgi:predicted RNA-binding Zn-ribbon protein involved in translation (DUF1610 family)